MSSRFQIISCCSLLILSVILFSFILLSFKIVPFEDINELSKHNNKLLFYDTFQFQAFVESTENNINKNAILIPAVPVSKQRSKIIHHRRRLLLFGYCIHFHAFDAQFAKYSMEDVPNHEFYAINLLSKEWLNSNSSMKELNEKVIEIFDVNPGVDKWQWTFWPTCGQYKYNLYYEYRQLIERSNEFYYNSNHSSIAYPSSRVVDDWYHNVFWPSTAHTIPLSHPSRPLIVGMSGEVFWEDSYGNGKNIDLELMRSKGAPKTLSFTGHWLQSAKGFHRRSYNRNERSLHLLQTEYQTRDNSTWLKIINNKTNFCVMIVKSVYKRGTYLPDSLVRHALFHLLSKQYKQCHSRGSSYIQPKNISRCSSKLGDIGSFLCMKDYKFSITMENTLREGYMSEKIFNGIFADTIPIYFGLPDIEKYNVNIDRIVYCNVSNHKILFMRSQQRNRGKIWMIDGLQNTPTDQQLIAWAVMQLKDELQPCIKEIIELDINPIKYLHKVKQSIFKSGTVEKSDFDGYYLGLGFRDILKTLKSYIFEDL